VSLGRWGVLEPGSRGRQGMFLLEPYDRDKSIVVLVHGFASSPLIWRELTNRLFGLAELRDRYQVWHYFYPTGVPYLYAAQSFRRSLQLALDEVDPEGDDFATHDVVLVGHSMGGILVKTAVSDSGDRVWAAAFSAPPAALDVSERDRRALEDIFFFRRLPQVTRAVFVMTPQRGSPLAETWYAGLGSSAVRLPPAFTGLMTRTASRNLDRVRPEPRDTILGGGPTAISALRPGYPVLAALADVPVDPRVPFDNVIGDLGGGRGDGVVSVGSASALR
jgi:pimeloyl-ACP methyl ester carboxylesterase